MEDRRVYRGIEEAALTGRWGDAEYRHTFLSRALRYEYRELRDRQRLIEADLTGISALYGHPKAKLDSGNDFVKTKMRELKATLPYIAGKGTVEKDREAAANFFNKVLANFDKLLDDKENTGSDTREKEETT